MMKKARIPALLLLFSSAALLEGFRLSSLTTLSNSDNWWHLSTGLWILEHHAFPRSGLFSQSSGVPWIAASWLYDLLLGFAYELLRLRSIPALLMLYKAALAVATFGLAGGLRGKFWPAVLLSAAAQFVLAPLPHGAVDCSILLFAAELLLLLHSNRNGSLRSLYGLVPLFLFWANLDPHFVLGLVLLILFVASRAFERSRVTGQRNLGRVAAIAAASILVTFFTPYFYRPYAVFFSTAFNSANEYLPGYRAPGFRQPQDFFLLVLVMLAFLALGMRRSRNLFQIVLLVGCALLSFRSQRDLWLVTLAAVAVIGEALPEEQPESDGKKNCSRRPLIAAVLSAGILIVTIGLRIPGNREVLLAKAARSYPVAASDYLRQHRLPQPLFNAYEWGGFLAWYLPEYPVAVDSRPDLYSDELVANYFKTMNAELRYTDYRPMAEAATVLLPRSAIMADALASLPIFEVVYRDDVSIVLVRIAAQTENAGIPLPASDSGLR